MLTNVLAALTLLTAAAPSDDGVRRHRDEPYLAIRTGLRCSACHVNRSGGGGRNDFGNIYAQTVLPRVSEGLINRAIGEFITVGGDFRLLGTAVVSETTPQTALEVEEANVYAEARLLRDRLTLYLDQTVGPNRSAAREVFALVDLPGSGYAKFGKFMAPFGLRLQDDAEFIRDRTGFTYNTPDEGMELGFEPGFVSFMVSLTNGAPGAAENDDHKQVTTTAALVRRYFRFGGSLSRNGTGSVGRDVVGGFGGFNVGPLSILGEVDLIQDNNNLVADAGDLRQLAAFGELDWLVTRGVNAKFTYGYLDPNRDIAENERIRSRIGLEVFPMQFLRVAGFYTIEEDIPQASNDRDRASVEVHIHF